MGHKLRVAHIITQLELGGAQRNTLYTVTHLNPDRFEPCLVSGPGGILDDEARISGIHTFFIGPLQRRINPFKDIYALIMLYRLLRHIRPDVVHTHSSKAGILGRVSAYLAGVPVIIHTFHGFGFTPDQSPWVRRLLVGIERFSALISTHLIFVSEENRRTADELGLSRGKATSLIRSGIQVDKIHGKSGNIREELGIPENAWVVTSVGNFKPQKNPMDLAHVAVSVLREDADVHFLFVGDGALRPDVEHFVNEQGVAANIHFLKWRQDVADILATSNAFLLTSLWEGLPRALIEAFAAGLPAVCYGVDGVREIIEEGKTGYLVEPRKTDAAAQHLIRLKTHPEDARAMGHRGAERVRQEFDIDRMVRQQEELYDKLFQAVPTLT